MHDLMYTTPASQAAAGAARTATRGSVQMALAARLLSVCQRRTPPPHDRTPCWSAHTHIHIHRSTGQQAAALHHPYAQHTTTTPKPAPTARSGRSALLSAVQCRHTYGLRGSRQRPPFRASPPPRELASPASRRRHLEVAATLPHTSGLGLGKERLPTILYRKLPARGSRGGLLVPLEHSLLINATANATAGKPIGRQEHNNNDEQPSPRTDTSPRTPAHPTIPSPIIQSQVRGIKR